jgi:hypothetical protein
MRLIVILIVGATLADGILAGGDVDRWLVGMPAWQTVGVVGWANYSRLADLGNGLVLYPLLAIGGTLLSVAAAVGFARREKREISVGIPIYAAAALTTIGLLLTLKAAPFMLSLRHIGNEDAASLQHAFYHFEFWGGLRAVFQTLAFGSNLWSLMMVGKYSKGDNNRSRFHDS